VSVVVNGQTPEPPPEPQAEPTVVRSPPVLACTQFPDVRPETLRAVVEAYGNTEAVVEVARKFPARNLPALVEEANVRGVVVAFDGNR